MFHCSQIYIVDLVACSAAAFNPQKPTLHKDESRFHSGHYDTRLAASIGGQHLKTAFAGICIIFSFMGGISIWRHPASRTPICLAFSAHNDAPINS